MVLCVGLPAVPGDKGQPADMIAAYISGQSEAGSWGNQIAQSHSFCSSVQHHFRLDVDSVSQLDTLVHGDTPMAERVAWETDSNHRLVSTFRPQSFLAPSRSKNPLLALGNTTGATEEQ